MISYLSSKVQLFSLPFPHGGGNYLDKFILDPERTDEIVADPDVVSLNTRKETVKQMYTFHRPVVEGDYSDQYSLNLYHYPLTGIWKIQRNSSSTQAEAAENPDGSRVESPYYWEDDAICCVTADSTMRIYPRGHALSVHVPWGINIASGDSQSGSLEYIPTHSTAELEEALVFLAEVPEETPDPAGSILVYENNIAVSLCGYYVLTGDLTLCSHDNTFTFNTTYSAYHTEGTYTEEDGILTLRHSYGTTVLRREGNNLVVESGEPLCMAGQPFTLAEEFYNELPAGTHLPLYTRGLLYHGTYTFGERASVTFDTENRTFTLTDAAGVTYEGSFTLSEKFVNCDAGGKIFQFIPYGGQVRLNQRDIEKVVPEEEDFIFFDFVR